MGHLLHRFFKNWLRINLLRKQHRCEYHRDHGHTASHHMPLSLSSPSPPSHISQTENGHKEYFIACLPSVNSLSRSLVHSLVSVVDVSVFCSIRDGKSILTVQCALCRAHASSERRGCCSIHCWHAYLPACRRYFPLKFSDAFVGDFYFSPPFLPFYCSHPIFYALFDCDKESVVDVYRICAKIKRRCPAANDVCMRLSLWATTKENELDEGRRRNRATHGFENSLFLLLPP